MSKSMRVTRDSLQAMLQVQDQVFVTKVVGRALVALMARQTEQERLGNTTQVDNGIGFTGSDARSGTITAKYFLKHGTLADWQVARWCKQGKNGYSRLSKYWRQLDEVAQRKAASVAV